MHVFIVLGGVLKDVQDFTSIDPETIHFVGIFKNKDEAVAAWRDWSQKNVDQAHKRYFVFPVDLEPKEL